MIRIFFFLFGLMLWVGDARADYTATPTGFQCNNSGWTKSTLHDACQYISSSISTPVPYAGGIQKSVEFGGPYPAAMGCHTFNSQNQPFGDQTCSGSGFTCPYGGTLINSNVSGKYVWTCVGANPPPTCPVNQATEDWFPATGKGAGFPMCQESGCLMSVSEVGSCVTLGSTGVKWCDMKGTLTGATCNAVTDNTSNTTYGPAQGSLPAGSTSPSTLPPTPSGGNSVPCPKGTVQGGFDQSGIAICIGTGSAPQNPQTPPPVTTKPPVTVNNADGSTTTTQQTVQTNSDGSTTTTTTTTVTGTDGTKTVNVGSSTSTNSAGTAGKQDTPNTDQMNLCKQNPTLSICQNSTVSGTCGQISCTGDAIQCATLRAAAALQCQQKQNEDDLKASPAYALGSVVLGGSDPAASTLPSPSKASAVTMPGTLDQTGWLGGGQCFADKVVTVQGRTFVLPYSKACDYLIVLRLGLMVIASLVSFRIVRDAVLS